MYHLRVSTEADRKQLSSIKEIYKHKKWNLIHHIFIFKMIATFHKICYRLSSQRVKNVSV